MIILIYLIILIVALAILFWQGSLIYAQILGAPTVYSNGKAIIDALALSQLKKSETVIDLGCGNAKSLIIAVKRFGAKGIGVERSPFCYLKSRWNVALAGESKNIKIIFGDFRKAEEELQNADVVYLYLLNSVLKSIESWLFDNIKKETRVVSLAFSFPRRKVIKKSKTRNLGRETVLRLYSK